MAGIRNVANLILTFLDNTNTYRALRPFSYFKEKIKVLKFPILLQGRNKRPIFVVYKTSKTNHNEDS